MQARCLAHGAIIALLTFAGCQSPYPYSQGYGYGGPYGPGGHPAPNYGGPPVYGQQGYPAGAAPAMNPNLGPAGAVPSYNGNAVVVPGTGITTQVPATPPSNYHPSSSGKTGLVPNYSDPAASSVSHPAGKPAPAQPPKSLGNPLDENADDFKDPMSSLPRRSDVPGLSELTNDAADDMSLADDEGIKRPNDVQVASGASIAPTPHLASRPNPFAHDGEHYTWLRGVVSYDDLDRTWRITYQGDGAELEPYKGNLALMQDDRFTGLLTNDVLYVEGYIDPRATDRFGKPMFRVTDALRLKPKQN